MVTMQKLNVVREVAESDVPAWERSGYRVLAEEPVAQPPEETAARKKAKAPQVV